MKDQNHSMEGQPVGPDAISRVRVLRDRAIELCDELDRQFIVDPLIQPKILALRKAIASVR